MPSDKKTRDKSAADPTNAGSAADSVVSDTDVEREDLLDALAIGEPGLDPLPVTLRGIDFDINRYYSPDTVWKWSDMQRADTSKMKPDEIRAGNRELLKVVIVEADHDKIDDILAVIDDRSVPEARRIYAYLNMKAGLTDKWGNPLAP